MDKHENDTIQIIFENLGNVYGYYQGLHGNALLHINAGLDNHTKEALIEAGKEAAQSGTPFKWLQIEK